MKETESAHVRNGTSDQGRAVSAARNRKVSGAYRTETIISGDHISSYGDMHTHMRVRHVRNVIISFFAEGGWKIRYKWEKKGDFTFESWRDWICAQFMHNSSCVWLRLECMKMRYDCRFRKMFWYSTRMRQKLLSCGDVWSGSVENPTRTTGRLGWTAGGGWVDGNVAHVLWETNNRRDWALSSTEKTSDGYLFFVSRIQRRTSLYASEYCGPITSQCFSFFPDYWGLLLAPKKWTYSNQHHIVLRSFTIQLRIKGWFGIGGEDERISYSLPLWSIGFLLGSISTWTWIDLTWTEVITQSTRLSSYAYLLMTYFTFFTGKTDVKMIARKWNERFMSESWNMTLPCLPWFVSVSQNGMEKSFGFGVLSQGSLVFLWCFMSRLDRRCLLRGRPSTESVSRIWATTYQQEKMHHRFYFLNEKIWLYETAGMSRRADVPACCRGGPLSIKYSDGILLVLQNRIQRVVDSQSSHDAKQGTMMVIQSMQMSRTKATSWKISIDPLCLRKCNT